MTVFRRERSTAALSASAATLLLFCASCGEDARPAPGTERERRRETADAEQDEIDQLRSLGYVDVGEPLDEDARTGVLRHDAERAAPGLTLLTSSHFCTAQLITMDGTVVHSWSYEPCKKWGNAVLLPDGDLLLVGRGPHEDDADEKLAARYLMRIAWDGSTRFQKTIPVHHDVGITPDGRIVSLTYGHRIIPEVHAEVPTRDHAVVLFSAEGELQEEVSFWQLLNSAPNVFKLQAVRPRTDSGKEEMDIFHSNAIEWMRHDELIGTQPFYTESGILTCLRHQDSVTIIDWSTKKLLWAWGQGEMSGPHDATLLENGNVLVFDNGLGRSWSRVVEVDPRVNEIVWQYQAPKKRSFYTETRGACQRLSNGNTLITESGKGHVFEVTPEGDIVWEYQNPLLTENREPSVIVRARRIEGISFSELEERARSGDAPWVD